MKKTMLTIALSGAALVMAQAAMATNEYHQEIEGPFDDPSQVTQTCLECHEDASMEVMKTTHWTWSAKQEVDGKGTQMLGKKNAINNFCISVESNWPRCTSCHVGYGWKDANFDFTDESKVDCLVCHDTTGTYKKPGPGAGMPAGYTGIAKLDKKKVDLVKVAQSAGKSTRANCVACYGFGGGGDNVKHGDIDSTIANPTMDIDFHMGTDSLNFSCQECHTTEAHQIKGNAMVVSPGGTNHISCTDCHDAEPHKSKGLNKHAASVACQTCHIPTYAKGKPTKTDWDWSTAGQDLHLPDDEYGLHTYVKKKGTFVWKKDIQPEYAWYNGSGGAYLRGEKMDPTKVTQINYPVGSKDDMNAKIYPFKVHRGKQIYDKKYNYFLTPKVWPAGEDKDAGFWKSFDWDAAVKAGVKHTGLKFSGDYGFAPTEMYWRLNHMVAPASEALQCRDCHGKKGRLDWEALGYEGDPMKKRGTARMSKK